MKKLILISLLMITLDQIGVGQQLSCYSFDIGSSGETSRLSSDPYIVSPKAFKVIHHIFFDDQGENNSLTPERIIEAMSIVNENFSNAQISFVSCDFINRNNTDRNISLYFGSQQGFQNMYDNYGIPSYINIYYSGSNSCSGQAFSLTSNSSLSTGVMIAGECPSLEKTLIHELGHLMSLKHTHGGNTLNTCTTDELVDGSNCETAGDEICDTPADPNINFTNNIYCQYTSTCPPDANGQPYAPDVSNHMSYATDNCRTNFTQQQNARMNEHANKTTTNPYLATKTSLQSVVYSQNILINSNQIEVQNLSVINNANVTLDGCETTIENLTVNPGSQLTIKH